MNNNETTITEKARKLDICPGCGEPKQVGCIVCWPCFKYRDNPFKEAGLYLMDWLDTKPTTDFRTKIARSGLLG